MIKFFKYIFIALLFIVAGLYFLEFIYTKSFNQLDFYRSKLQYVLKDNLPKYDIVVLGSSRANNHIVTKEFESVNLNAFNFGMSGSSLEDSFLLLNLILEKNTPKFVLLQVDLNIKNDAVSEAHRISALPYITSSKFLSDYYSKEITNFKLYKTIPFYKYIKFDSRIGFREFVMNTIQKKSKHLSHKGFTPLSNNLNIDLSFNMSNYKPKKNKFYDKIKALCELHNIKLIAFTTPMCENAIGRNYFDKIKNIYPEVHQLENVVTDNRYFSTCGHMNKEGAQLFTEYLIENFF